MISAAEKATINQALERTSGDRPTAAALLGVRLPELQNKIFDCPDLAVRWASTKEERDNPQVLPTESQLMHRPVKSVPDIDQMAETGEISEADKEMAEIVASEDSLLKRGLQNIGLTPEEAQLGLELQRLHHRQFRQTMEIAGAGAVRMQLKLHTIADHVIETRLKKVIEMIGEKGKLVDEERALLVDEEKKLVESLVLISGEIRKHREASDRGALTLAMIKLRAGKGEKMAKPGYQTAAIPT